MNFNNYSLFNCRTCKRHFTSIKNLNDHRKICTNTGDIVKEANLRETSAPKDCKERNEDFDNWFKEWLAMQQ